MLLGLLALVPSLLVSPPAGGGDQLSRRVLLRGAAASVLTVSAAANAEDFGGEFAKQGLGFQERPSSLGSAGISAYQQLKLQTALDDLAAPAADAPSSLKPTLEVSLPTHDVAHVTPTCLHMSRRHVAPPMPPPPPPLSHVPFFSLCFEVFLHISHMSQPICFILVCISQRSFFVFSGVPLPAPRGGQIDRTRHQEAHQRGRRALEARRQ